MAQRVSWRWHVACLTAEHGQLHGVLEDADERGLCEGEGEGGEAGDDKVHRRGDEEHPEEERGGALVSSGTMSSLCITR